MLCPFLFCILYSQYNLKKNVILQNEINDKRKNDDLNNIMKIILFKIYNIKQKTNKNAGQ